MGPIRSNPSNLNDPIPHQTESARALSALDKKQVHARLDETDLAILAILQEDGRITNVELARRLGMSPPPCLRRVRALEEAGIIRSYRAILDEKKLGFEVVVFAMVNLASQAEADLKSFEDHIRSWSAVRECWTLSGEIDFLLKCVTPDLKTLHALVTELTGLPNVRTIRTALALERVKDEPIAPLAPTL